MPKGSIELTNSRRNEIIEAVVTLYETMNFKDITMKEISNATSFSRPSIYNYFQTKEEIFLAILQKEYELWIEELETILNDYKTLSIDELADLLAQSIEHRSRMLKIMSMNHYDMESNSRMENLIEFKIAYGKSMHTVTRIISQFCPYKNVDEIQDFIYAFFPFLFGIYPYTIVSDKQRDAMDKAKANYVFLSIYQITYSCIKKLLQ